MLSLFWRGRTPVILSLGKYACWLNRHAPYHRRAIWDGKMYVSRCRHCGQPIKRIARHQWRKQDGETQESPAL